MQITNTQACKLACTAVEKLALSRAVFRLLHCSDHPPPTTHQPHTQHNATQRTPCSHEQTNSPESITVCRSNCKQKLRNRNTEVCPKSKAASARPQVGTGCARCGVFCLSVKERVGNLLEKELFWLRDEWSPAVNHQLMVKYMNTWQR